MYNIDKGGYEIWINWNVHALLGLDESSTFHICFVPKVHIFVFFNEKPIAPQSYMFYSF